MAIIGVLGKMWMPHYYTGRLRKASALSPNRIWLIVCVLMVFLVINLTLLLLGLWTRYDGVNARDPSKICRTQFCLVELCGNGNALLRVHHLPETWRIYNPHQV